MTVAAEFYLRAAQSHLEAARFCHEGEQFGVAIAEAYHSVLASVKVRLLKRGKDPPNRHSRSLRLLYHEFVETGDVTRNVSRFVHQMQAYRDDWNYEAELPDPPEGNHGRGHRGCLNPNSVKLFSRRVSVISNQLDLCLFRRSDKLIVQIECFLPDWCPFWQPQNERKGPGWQKMT